jgi:HEAT repeat protein
MKRNYLLLTMTLFGALAVGALLLLTGGGAGGVRADGTDARGSRADPRTGGAAAAGAGAATKRGQQVTPEMARNPMRGPAMAVRPGLREPFDDEATIQMRERSAGRIEELLLGMTNPLLRADERMALGNELQNLLRQLGHRVSPAVRERLLQMLASAAPTWKDQIAGAIGSLQGDAGTAQALLEMLRNTPSDVSTRRAIYSALGMMNVREVTPVLMSMLGQGLEDEPLIIRTVGSLASPEELEQLFGRLDRPLIAASRVEIERILQEKGGVPGLLDKVSLALETADVQKRRSLLKILGASRDPAHAAKVRELLKSETDPESRAIAIQTLGKFGDLDSGKALMDLVQHGSQEDQGRAIQAIHSIHQRDTIGVLAEGYSGFTPEGRNAVMGAISRIPAPTEEMLKLAQERGLLDVELRVRNAAARVLGKRGREESVEPLVHFLDRSTHPAERSAALSSLETIHTNKAALAAIRALRVVPSDRERDRWEKRFQAIAEETAEKNDTNENR